MGGLGWGVRVDVNEELKFLSKGRNLTRGDNSGKTRNMRRLFFHEESIHEVSRRYLEHEYV